jgi:hypothetical protein
MNSFIYLFSLLAVGFVVYFFLKDYIFDNSFMHQDNNVEKENFEVPAPASIEIRQAPLYPPRTISPSGPNPPNQAAPNNEIVMYGEPEPKDPYYESQESSDVPERLRYPERSFRPAPMNDNTTIAVQGGIASNNIQVTSDNSQVFQPDFIEGGGEFMPGIYANDILSDKSYSAF